MSEYQLMAGDPYGDTAKVKTNKTKKGAKTMKRANNGNVPRVTNINDLSTSTIIWHLVRKHKFTIAVLYGVVMTTLYIVKFLPPAINSIK